MNRFLRRVETVCIVVLVRVLHDSCSSFRVNVLPFLGIPIFVPPDRDSARAPAILELLVAGEPRGSDTGFVMDVAMG